MVATSKVCLINPPTTDPQERSLFFPYALLALGGVLHEEGVEAELWDFDLYFKAQGNQTEHSFRCLLEHGVKGAGTPIFGISAICSNLPMALWLAMTIKEIRPEAQIILGGAQPSALPGRILECFPAVDMVVIGEGEETLRELVQCGFDPQRYFSIAGLAYRNERGVQLTPRRELIEDLDQLPYPDYSLINLDHYRVQQQGQLSPQVEVGRGCPFTCTFCSTSLMWSRNYRIKSPERILAEMEWLFKRSGETEFDFTHDNFTTSKSFIEKFADYFIANNHHHFRWGASSRTDCLNEKRLEKMHRAGLGALFFGVESGSPRIQKIIRKNLDLTRFESILKKMRELKIAAVTAFILGFPEETMEDVDQTVRQALHYKELGVEKVYFSKLSALAGTSLYLDHLAELTESNFVSSISPQHYGLSYIKQIIHENPKLFSSYYHIPHPEFDAIALWKLIEFSQLLVDACPERAEEILDRSHETIDSLFRKWDEWAEQNSISYCDFNHYTASYFQEDFERFLQDKALRGTA